MPITLWKTTAIFRSTDVGLENGGYKGFGNQAGLSIGLC